LTNPELRSFIKEIIAAIGRATCRFLERIGSVVLRSVRAVKRRMDEAAEIHNRQMAILDERYSRNWYHLRNIL
jgi:hypothetical protein